MVREKEVGKQCFKNAAFRANFSVIRMSQYNVKSNACYAMKSIFARGPVTRIHKSNVLTAGAHKNCLINT